MTGEATSKITAMGRFDHAFPPDRFSALSGLENGKENQAPILSWKRPHQNLCSTNSESGRQTTFSECKVSR